MKSVIGILCLLLVPVFLGFVAKDNIERGTLRTWYLEKSIWASFILGAPVIFLAVNPIIPGECADHGPVVGTLLAVVFFLSVAGVFLLPVFGAVILVYAFGYLFWLVGGRRRIQPSDPPQPASTTDSTGATTRSDQRSFGKREDKLK